MHVMLEHATSRRREGTAVIRPVGCAAANRGETTATPGFGCDARSRPGRWAAAPPASGGGSSAGGGRVSGAVAAHGVAVGAAGGAVALPAGAGEVGVDRRASGDGAAAEAAHAAAGGGCSSAPTASWRP